MPRIINGSKIARMINKHTKERINNVQKTPMLATILVKTGNLSSDEANRLYVHMKSSKAQKLGITTRTFILNNNITQEKLTRLVQKLNNSDRVTGILLQLPLPKQINETQMEELISPNKDVDGVNPKNIGKLATNVNKHDQFYFTGATPTGIIKMLKDYYLNTFNAQKKANKGWTKGHILNEAFFGKRVVVLGRSNIVGRPVTLMLTNLGCEVTELNHLYSTDANLSKYTKHADIIVSATGHPNTIKQNQLTKGKSVLIDAGEDTDPNTHKLCGDISEGVKQLAKATSTVPHGVGPMTIASLLRNVAISAKMN